MRYAFIKGITDSGNEYIMSDLYRMDFKSDMTEEEYLRDANYRASSYIAPAKLVGWFDRVWTYGFAYGDKTMKMMDKAMTLCSAARKICGSQFLTAPQERKNCARRIGIRIFKRDMRSVSIFSDIKTDSKNK